MNRILPFVCAAALLVPAPGSHLSAQFGVPGLPGDDIASLALQFGILSPTTTLPDGASWDSGTGVGAALAYWPFHHLGLRTSVFRSQTDGQQPDPPAPFSGAGAQDPVVWLYNLEAAVRRPMVGDRLAGFPYLTAGIGGKSYRWSIDRPRVGNTTFALAFAGGLDLRAASAPRFGAILELRNHRSSYKWHGFQPDPPVINDLQFTAGVALNF